MLLTKRWLGRIAEVTPDDQLILDAARLVRHLLMFDQVVLESIRLREIAPLVKCFGYDGVIALLRSGALRIHANALTVGQVGQTAALRMRKGLLPLHSYSFGALTNGRDRRDHVSGCLQNVRKTEGISFKQEKALVREVVSRLIDPVDAVGPSTVAQFQQDLRSNAPHLKVALSIELRRRFGSGIDVSPVALVVQPINDEDFAVETNVPALFGVSIDQSHEIVGTALLAVGGLNQRLAEMNHYDALVNFWYRDLPILGEKLAYLQGAAGPEGLDQRVATVLALPTLPNLEDALLQGELSIEKLLDVRGSDEAVAFRAWVQGASAEDVAELRERSESVRAKLGLQVGSVGGRAVRLAVTTGIGAVPGAGFALGAVAGAVDTFLVERLFGPVPKPLAFLFHGYKSIFR